MEMEENTTMIMDSVKAQRITSERFARYGKVARLDGTEPLAEGPQFQFWSDVAAFEVEGPTEIGYCTVVDPADQIVNWMERHARTPEVLIPIDWPFILPVMMGEEVEAFEVHPGEAVVINPDVWHSACLPLGRMEATYFVIFRRGTPHEDVAKQEIGGVRIEKEQA